MKNCGMKLSEYFEIIIERNKKISVKDRLKNLLTIFKECCKTVKIIHDLGYLHLDIKPENFLINDNNQVKIIRKVLPEPTKTLLQRFLQRFSSNKNNSNTEINTTAKINQKIIYYS